MALEQQVQVLRMLEQWQLARVFAQVRRQALAALVALVLEQQALQAVLGAVSQGTPLVVVPRELARLAQELLQVPLVPVRERQALQG